MEVRPFSSLFSYWLPPADCYPLPSISSLSGQPPSGALLLVSSIFPLCSFRAGGSNNPAVTALRIPTLLPTPLSFIKFHTNCLKFSVAPFPSGALTYMMPGQEHLHDALTSSVACGGGEGAEDAVEMCRERTSAWKTHSSSLGMLSGQPGGLGGWDGGSKWEGSRNLGQRDAECVGRA